MNKNSSSSFIAHCTNLCNSQMLLNWTFFLCNTKQLEDLFLKRLEPKYFSSSVIKFRRYLLEEVKRGQEIDIEKLQKLMNNRQIEEIRLILEELFLEPIHPKDMRFMEEAIKNNYTAEEIITAHKNDIRERHLYIMKQFTHKK